MTVTYHRETHHTECSKCLLLALRHAIKQSHHWSIHWSMKLCWLLTIFQSNAISAHGHTSLVSDKHIPVFLFQSVSPGASALVWFSCSQGWKWMMHRTITVMSCCSTQTLAGKLLPDICQAADDFYFPVHHHTYVHRAAVTRLRTSHQTRGLPIDHTSIL